MVILKHKDTGLTKECPTGFSWTVFFFGVFVPLMRGDLKWAAILFALAVLVGIPTLGLGSFLVGPIFAFFYNKIYIRGLMSTGFVPADDHSYNWCVVNGLLAGQLISTQTPPAAPLPQEEPLPAIEDKNKTDEALPLLEKSEEGESGKEEPKDI